MKAELLNISNDDYHANAFSKTPCYSNSIGKLILNKSPKHAYLAHPLLNKDYEGDDEARFSIGIVAHAALLEGIDICEPLDFSDYRTKAAQEARDAAYLAGKVPLLQKQFDEVKQMISAGIAQIEACKDLGNIKLSDGKAEQTLVLTDDDLQIKVRLDWLKDDYDLIIDYKTTDIATPGAWIRAIAGNGYDMQAALYTNAVHKMTGKMPRFIFAVQETSAPYAMYFVGASQQLLEHGESRTNRAIEIWKQCLKTNVWPMYNNSVMWAELPPWVQGDWIMQEAMNEDSGVWKKFTREQFLFGSVK